MSRLTGSSPTVGKSRTNPRRILRCPGSESTIFSLYTDSPEFRAGTGFYTVKTADPTQRDPRIRDVFQELPQVLTIGHAQVILKIQSRSRVQSRSI
jgi:hypothetical protein